MRELLGGALILLATRTAWAEEPKSSVVLLKTVGEPAEQAQELDATLRDGVQDLGLKLPVADASGMARDVDLVDRAGMGDGAWVISPRVEMQDGNYVVRILAVAPNSKEIRTRVEIVKAPDVAARGLVMLRDLLKQAPPATTPAPCPPTTVVQAPPATRSAGRAVLAINGTVYGGFIAYSLQRVNQKDEGFGDPRVAIPLAALGAGVGLGASLLVAEEWDITPAMAWYVTGGTWWGVTSGLLLGSGFEVGNGPAYNERFYAGIAGGAVGLSLATFALTRKRVDDGGMLIQNSGAVLGLFVGGLVQVIADGPNDPFAQPISKGWGFGAAFGVATGGVLGLLVRVPPTRVLLGDLGAVLGGLVGAAAASPLIVDNLNPDKTRGWAIATIGGAVLGTGAALWFTRGMKAPPVVAFRYGMPYVGVIGTSHTRTGDVPVMGLGWQGRW